MLTSPWITCLWPGLTDLWVYGRWRGLIWATLFTLVLNAALILRAVWPELAGEPIRSGIWYLLGLFWLAGAAVSLVRLVTFDANQVNETVEALFQTAQSEYLKGNHLLAEATLLRLLKQNPCDAEALLMMATLMRHTQRFAEARSQLSRLEKLDAAQAWQEEIVREYRLLEDRENDASEDERPEDLPDTEETTTDNSTINFAA
ncbi:MAG: hypothetical protein COA78_08665 [Blastopirellula sp.]|nr:MAG: hypothetical protein COA78_08665 [Blastopirellula sp.]